VADLGVARDIRCHIEANCLSIALQDEAVVSSATEVLKTVDGALSADIVLLLLSPDAIPSLWSRQQWEPVLLEQPRELGTALAFVLVRPCRFPEILRKRKFFDLTGDTRDGLRKLRRWLLQQDPLKRESIELLPPRPYAPGAVLEMDAGLEDLIIDQPGTQCEVPRETALAFAYAHGRDFEGVFWLDCLGRSRAGVIGDTAHALGLKLRGPTTENTVALQEFCARSRCLFVFDALAAERRELVAFKGRPSVIFATGSEQQASGLPLAETVQLFARWRTDPEQCLRHLRDAERYLHALEPDCSAETAQAVKSLGASAFALLQQQDRRAEAFEILQILSKLACEEGNASDFRRWEWEKSWIREAWGQVACAPPHPPTMSEPRQLEFDFSG
jgi:hypothetical protein